MLLRRLDTACTAERLRHCGAQIELKGCVWPVRYRGAVFDLGVICLIKIFGERTGI